MLQRNGRFLSGALGLLVASALASQPIDLVADFDPAIQAQGGGSEGRVEAGGLAYFSACAGRAISSGAPMDARRHASPARVAAARFLVRSPRGRARRRQAPVHGGLQRDACHLLPAPFSRLGYGRARGSGAHGCPGGRPRGPPKGATNSPTTRMGSLTAEMSNRPMTCLVVTCSISIQPW